MVDIQRLPIDNPAGVLTQHAVAYADSDGLSVTVAPAAPLPVALTTLAAPVAPLAGTTTNDILAGPFVPLLGRPIWVSLAGDWSGTVQVMRSLDQGASMAALTVGGQAWASYSANANEPIGEETVADACYYLAVTLSSGSLAYRVQQ